MSMLSEFLNQNGIKPEELLAASRGAEHIDIEGRALLVARVKARADKKAYAELNIGKPKGLGRPLSAGSLQRALAGQPLPRLVRHKILAAVNARLVSLKKDQVVTRPLFQDVKVRRGKAKKK